MRRALAIVLALVFALGPCTPWIEAEDAHLPFCCRRDGTHHCAMASEASAVASAMAHRARASLRTPAHCPCYPANLPANTAPFGAVLPETAEGRAPARQGPLPAPVLASLGHERTRARGVRGPPARRHS